MSKILFVVTSHDKLGETGEPTGYYMGEVTHAWKVLKDNGFEIDFVSPKGGELPVYGVDLEDAINKEFLENTEYKNKIDNSFTPSQIKAEDYEAIFFAGGHGTMWDFPNNEELAKIASEIYEKGGVVSGVCHGVAGLLNIKLSNGEYLVKGKKVNAFTNEEETEIKLEKIVPFLLEDALIEKGAIFEKSGNWQKHIAVDERLITGQNPQSAYGVGEAMVELLKERK